MTNNNNFSVEDIWAFIHGELDENDTKKIQSEIESNKGLREIYHELSEEKADIDKQLKEIDSDPKLDNLYNRVLKASRISEPGVSQLWKLKDFDLKVFIYDKFEDRGFDVYRVMPVTNMTTFAAPYDVLINDEAVIHTHLIFNILRNNLERYSDELPAAVLDVVNEKSQEETIGEYRFTRGNAINEFLEEDFEIWTEIMRKELYPLQEKTLTVIETAQTPIFRININADTQRPDYIDLFTGALAADDATNIDKEMVFWSKEREQEDKIQILNNETVSIALKLIENELFAVIYSKIELKIENIYIEQNNSQISPERKNLTVKAMGRKALLFDKKIITEGNAKFVIETDSGKIEKDILFELEM